MKSKRIGLIILAVVIALAVAYQFLLANRPNDVTLSGYLGGEKIGLFEDQEVNDILKKNDHLILNYSKAGSFDMIRADLSGRDYLFPSSQTALELYEKQIGKPLQAEIIFNTPIVFYSRQVVADALIKEGLVTEKDGVYKVIDMPKLVQYMEEGKTWSQIGLPQLYGPILVHTTDPVKSNSGNMFAGLMANVLNNNRVVDASSIAEVLPRLTGVFHKLGYMETSSADLFEQFLRTGMGAKPLIAGYESQILEFAVTRKSDWEKVKDDIVILYPEPTVWSSHVYIALTENGKKGIEALRKDDIQKIAWEKHGFRTNVYTKGGDHSGFGVKGVADEVTQVMPMPDVATMEQIMQALQ